ncbi:hypothetical protein AT15_02415 [Kosmotoga arenicorallina S304]|uniref:Uncharacterized protein n=1 Tax=Kosmotoga arenicorallina S304 TaxID=1453497 RepID=A0A176K3U3_9BACT|nr:hypothetical protein [Kosmotoga arenicorallina]OAA31701.1 hypothetical protein AT15_02415 [Kosmotoga arenicorallina S304]
MFQRRAFKKINEQKKKLLKNEIEGIKILIKKLKAQLKVCDDKSRKLRIKADIANKKAKLLDLEKRLKKL